MPAPASNHSDATDWLLRPMEPGDFDVAWRLQRGYELVWIERGQAHGLVGDRLMRFGPGEGLLLGPGLPHAWLSDPQASAAPAGVLLRFSIDFLGPNLLARADMAPLAQLLQRSRQGLAFTSGDLPPHAPTADLPTRLAALATASPLGRLTGLLQLLEILAHAPHTQSLMDAAYQPPTPADPQRRDRACRFIRQHYREDLSLNQVAAAVGLSPTAFSRWFRRETGWNFIQYVHALRVAYACHKLTETRQPILEICFEAGFTNLSNFNRIFLRLRQQTPRDHRQQATGP